MEVTKFSGYSFFRFDQCCLSAIDIPSKLKMVLKVVVGVHLSNLLGVYGCAYGGAFIGCGANLG